MRKWRLWFTAGYGCDRCGRKDRDVAKPKGGHWQEKWCDICLRNTGK